MMKRQQRQLLLLVCALLLCVIGYFILRADNAKTQAEQQARMEAENAAIDVMKIDADTINAFSYQVNGETLSFTKSQDGWSYDTDPSLAVSENSISSLLANVTAVTADTEMTDVTQLSEYGLDNPVNTVTVSTREQTHTFYIGNYNQTAACYYFMVDDSSTVYTMKGGLCTAFDQTIDDLTEKNTEKN